MVPPFDKIAFRGNDLIFNAGSNFMDLARIFMGLAQDLSHNLSMHWPAQGCLVKVIVYDIAHIWGYLCCAPSYCL